MLQTENITYYDDDVKCIGYYACETSNDTKKPLVVVVHDWTGRNELACQKAQIIAQLGYVGFAVDVFGDAKLGKTNEEKTALIQPFMKDRASLLRRLMAGVEAAKKMQHADTSKIAAIGFCFGGLCVLDIARSGADVKAVASFHGLLNAPTDMQTQNIKSRVLALHGFDDPMATHEQVIQFGVEMTSKKADWELNMYGNTMHGFTNPEAHDPVFGTVYNKEAADKAWQSMKNLFDRVFG